MDQWLNRPHVSFGNEQTFPREEHALHSGHSLEKALEHRMLDYLAYSSAFDSPLQGGIAGQSEQHEEAAVIHAKMSFRMPTVILHENSFCTELHTPCSNHVLTYSIVRKR